MNNLIFDSFLSEFATGEIDLSNNKLMLTLHSDTYVYDATMKTYAPDDISELITNSGYTRGGKQLQNQLLVAGDNYFTLQASDVFWSGTSITARYAILWDAKTTYKPIAVFDLEENITTTNESFTISWTDSNVFILSSQVLFYSTYELWLAAGNVGTPAEFFAFLYGVSSVNGKTGEVTLDFSTGAFTVPEIIDNEDGTATIPSLDVNLFPNADYSGNLARYTLAEKTLSFSTDTEEFVVADYNGGSPIIRKETDQSNVNGSSIVGLLICWRQDGIIHSISQGAIALGLANKIDRALYNTIPYRRSVDGGLILSASETPSSRTVIVSSAVVYGGSTPFIIEAFNSSTDILTRVAHVSGEWTYEKRLVYGNSNWDNGTDVVPLNDNRYVNRFFYRSIGDVKEVFYTLGSQEFYNESNTYLELPPTPPILLRDHCVYVGRIAVSKDSELGAVCPAFDCIDEYPESLTYQSAGVRVLPEFSTGDGTITVGDGDYLLYEDDDFNISGLNKYTISGGTFVLTEGVVNHLVANYNNGNPEIQLITDVDIVTESSVIPIITCYSIDGDVLTLNWDHLGKGLVNKLNRRLVKTNRFEVEPGNCTLGELTGRYVTLSAGTLWYGGVETSLDSIDSSLAESDIAFYYSENGVWTRTLVDTYNNSQYNATDGLSTLLPNRYAVNWIYRGISNDSSSLILVLGTENYQLGGAQDSLPPALPAVLANFTILVGRIIVERYAETATQIDSAFANSFSPSGITDHNALANLQGGETDNYFHSNQEINKDSTPEFAGLTIGTTENNSEIENDGTLKFNGTATTWDDVVGSLIGRRLSSVVGRVDYNWTENSITFSDGGTVTNDNDVVNINQQYPHSARLGTGATIDPHIHWWQPDDTAYEFTLQYRIQNNNELKVETWVTITATAGVDDIYTYPGSGIFNNILAFPSIDISEITISSTIQFRLARTDNLGGTADVTFFDFHAETNTIGSREKYSK